MVHKKREIVAKFRVSVDENKDPEFQLETNTKNGQIITETLLFMLKSIIEKYQLDKFETIMIATSILMSTDVVVVEIKDTDDDISSQSTN